MDLAIMLRDRFPKVGALFLAGELNARRVWLSSDRTYLVTDAEALAELDSVIAERLTTWGPLSEHKLAQAIDVWVDKIDPGALVALATRRAPATSQSPMPMPTAPRPSSGDSWRPMPP
jgi:hypothetical protein